MSKKNKIRKKTFVQRPPIVSKLPNSPSPVANSLILFDNKVRIVLLIMVALYVIMSFLKLHTSSVAAWDQVFGIKNPESIVSGVPRAIRQDEWMLETPALIGQYQNGFPISNMAVGDGNIPVLFSFPIKDISMMLRPNLWPYFIFDVERAFAFSWNFKIFFFLISTFLLFLLFTKNNFWLSLFGAFFIFLSSSMQWWSYLLGAQMTYLNGVVISIIYLLYSKKIKAMIIAGIILLICSYSFITTIYPPWQIPLFYLYTILLLGYLIKRKEIQTIKEKKWLRIAIISGAAIFLLFFLFHYYGLIRNTYDIMMNTAYPGKRTTNGGDLANGKLFSEFFGIYMTDLHYPDKWLNICEVSSSIMFFPVIFYSLGYNYIKTKKIDWQTVALSVYILILLIWMLIGFPSFLSKLTLFSMSPAYRTLPIAGIANSFLLISFLANKEPRQASAFSWTEFGILAIITVVFIGMIAGHINTVTDHFFSQSRVIIVIVLMSVLYLLIRYKQIRFIQPVLLLLLLGISISNIRINPITSGLSAVLDNPLIKTTKEIQQKDPNARWAVFGNMRAANLIKANGINVFNGVKVTPLLKDMHVLDSSGKNNFIYNRYGHIRMLSLINGRDSIQFDLNENAVVNDVYTIHMDPCSPRLQKLGVKYFIFTAKPHELEIRCMTLVKDLKDFHIYKRNEP